MFIFDGQSEFYRCPQGGIMEGNSINIKIHLKKSSSPKIRIEKKQDYSSFFYKELSMEWVGTEKSYDLYQVEFNINEAGNYLYYFIINESIESKAYELLIFKENFKTPEWIKGGIIYHIFVDRFYRENILKKDGDIVIRSDWGNTPQYLSSSDGEIKNNDFFGGNLEGIIYKLPYLKELGVTAIYLSPIFEAYSNHKYDIGDYFTIDTMFGDENSLVELCKKARYHSINIILDGVFSHTGVVSKYFNKYGLYKSTGAYQSKESIYYDWYIFNRWNEDYACWWGVKTLPTINKNSKSYINFITGEDGVLNYWQKKGIKGWRLDVADELPNEFLEKLRWAVKKQDDDAFIVGEVWEDASNKMSYGKLKEYFCGNQLDSVTNYPLRNAIIEYLNTKDCTKLNDTINFILEKYPPQAVNCLMNILGTHDTARIITVLGTNKIPESKSDKAEYKLSTEELKNAIKLLKIASLLQFTLPGVPCIYYGDEVGVEGFEDPFNRACFPWGNENKEIQSHYIFLSQLRKNKLFIDGKYKNHIHDGGVFAFERYNDETRLIIAVNISCCTVTLNLKDDMKEYGKRDLNNSFKINSGEYLILMSN